VAIAGGGLAGLVTAAAVRRACPGVTVKVRLHGSLTGLQRNSGQSLLDRWRHYVMLACVSTRPHGLPKAATCARCCRADSDMAAVIRIAGTDASARPQVFEQFPRYQKAGALLGLAPNTQKALAAIDPALLQAAEPTVVPDGRSITFDHEGDALKSGRRADMPC
jgi:2-polyprenyl-6-methoxyphenol hydroxylase-like FAD-dependent oxidoreductase